MSDEKFDDIAHPARYCEGRNFEPKDVMMSYDPYAMLFFTLKYISRCGRKDEQTKEVRKMIQYIDFLLEWDPNNLMQSEHYDKYAVVIDWDLPRDLAMSTCLLMDVLSNHYNGQKKEPLPTYVKNDLILIKAFLEHYLKELEE